MADSSTTVQKISAEALGTFILVFIGCGTAIFSGGDYVAIGLAFGLTVLARRLCVRPHHRRATSTPPYRSGRRSAAGWPGARSATYVGAQFVGRHRRRRWCSSSSSRASTAMTSASRRLAQNSFGDHGTGYAWWAALLVEIMLTAIFVYVILAVTDARNEHPALAPLAIGLTLAMIHFASISAHRHVGQPGPLHRRRRSSPAATRSSSSGCSSSAPLIGAAIAGLTYPLLFGHGTDPVAGSGLELRPARAGRAVPGYGAPDQYQQEWNQQQAAQDQAAWEQEPIIQDGWQWDHAAQEWKPARAVAAAGSSRPRPPARPPRSTPARTSARQPAPQPELRRPRPSSPQPPPGSAAAAGDPGDGAHPGAPARAESVAGLSRARLCSSASRTGPSVETSSIRPTPRSSKARFGVPGSSGSVDVEAEQRRCTSRRRRRTTSSRVSTVIRTSTTPASVRRPPAVAHRGAAGIARPASAPSSPASQTPSRPNHHDVAALSWA